MAMTGDPAADLDIERLRRSGHWALYWELVHARGSQDAVRATWATLTDEERPAARAGLTAAASARHDRFAARARAKAAARLDGPREYVEDLLGQARQASQAS